MMPTPHGGQAGGAPGSAAAAAAAQQGAVRRGGSAAGGVAAHSSGHGDAAMRGMGGMWAGDGAGGGAAAAGGGMGLGSMPASHPNGGSNSLLLGALLTTSGFAGNRGDSGMRVFLVGRSTSAAGHSELTRGIVLQATAETAACASPRWAAPPARQATSRRAARCAASTTPTFTGSSPRITRGSVGGGAVFGRRVFWNLAPCNARLRRPRRWGALTPENARPVR